MAKNEISVEEAKHELRLREWEERIKKCKASGISVKDWFREKNRNEEILLLASAIMEMGIGKF